MLKSGLKLLLALILVFTTIKCIDPYFPKLKSFEPLLVVEGLVTNDSSSYIVRLSNTIQDKDSSTKKISDAVVYISDESGLITHLTAYGDGIYKTDSLTFRGEPGKSYQLHIKTANGKEYASDTCLMYPVPELDSVYYGKDLQLQDNQSVTRLGISVYIDTKRGTEDKYFLRWDYDEAWRFRVLFPTRYQYINDTTINLLPPEMVKEFCWKYGKSTEIRTGAILSGSENQLTKQPVAFISPELSDRLSIRYSILVKQYSLSQKEYDYWNNLKEVSETKGDIFGSQPYPVLSNIKNINDPSEQVPGYFQVSAVSKKRIFIDFTSLVPLGLPNYHPPCKRTVMGPSDYPPTSPYSPPTTFNHLYEIFITTKGYVFVEPVYDATGFKLQKLVFSPPECANCELTGTTVKPDFWTDN